MSMVQLALKRPYTFIVMAILIVLGTPFALKNMATEVGVPIHPGSMKYFKERGWR